MAKDAISEARAAKLLRLYMKGGLASFEAFCKECIKITGGDDASGDTSAIPFKWWPSQREFAAALCDPESREITADKSRQIGITWIVLAWMLYRAMFWHGIEERITSVGQDEASKALRRVKFMIDHLPWWCSPPLELSNTTTIKFADTQSWISALPATINAGRGDTLNDILLDEAAFQVYCKEIARSAGPSLEKRHGKLIMVSTANGVGNHFQQTYSDAQAGKNGFKAFFFGWDADPSRNQKWYDKMYAEKGAEYMHENYPRTWQESFLATGRPYFDQARMTVDLYSTKPPFHDGFLDGPNSKMEFVHAKGALRVWKKPTGRPAVIGCDVAEGTETGDSSAGYVLDATTREILARIYGKMDVTELADLLCQVGEWYGVGQGEERMPALLAIEANNNGIGAIKRCLDNGYRNLWMDRNLVSNKMSDRTGWWTSEQSRRLMLARFQSEYRMGRAQIVDRELLEEMALFAHRGPRGKAQAPVGSHDDRVLGYGIAHFIATYECPVEEEKPVEGAGPRYWAQKEVDRMKEGAEDDPLNAGLVEMGG